MDMKYVFVCVCSGAGDKEKGYSMSWDFDSESSVTMVRMPKSKEAEPTGENHTPNHHGNDNGEVVAGRVEAVDGEGEGARTPVTEQPLQLGIDDTAFVSTGQRSSVVSAGGGDRGKRGSVVEGEREKRGSVISIEGNSRLVVVSKIMDSY